jgi:ADP-ribose pyrophosphatase YjhB (NUDIX family)
VGTARRGGVEAGETLERALRREIREKLGLELRTIEPLLTRRGLTGFDA